MNRPLQRTIAGELVDTSTGSTAHLFEQGQMLDRDEYKRSKQSPSFPACIKAGHDHPRPPADCGVQVQGRTCGCPCHRPKFEGM
jgi:hypothetical protein